MPYTHTHIIWVNSNKQFHVQSTHLPESTHANRIRTYVSNIHAHLIRYTHTRTTQIISNILYNNIIEAYLRLVRRIPLLVGQLEDLERLVPSHHLGEQLDALLVDVVRLKVELGDVLVLEHHPRNLYAKRNDT